MRRWFSIVLLVLLPLQFTWAVAASYCQHEVATGEWHFGHHMHQHASLAQQDASKGQGGEASQHAGSVLNQKSAQDDPASPGKLSVDNDCGVCHLGTSNAVGEAPSSLALPGGEIMHGVDIGTFSTRAPDHPDRPNWRIA
ncbi:hypothetical protein SAMN05216359_108144 [Roseateles sp. YR242]|uniref:hypothetical protein n=1 Tax=Roseateles sp. YR242 TaxID=1855305 RepID=UPI0008D4DA73|nr:hypothetical protein [Roseateles sp. YR242]SEL39110.1 hypothetical protein SAMN05216359_108144 [Roseateles sp. YR242]